MSNNCGNGDCYLSKLGMDDDLGSKTEGRDYFCICHPGFEKAQKREETNGYVCGKALDRCKELTGDNTAIRSEQVLGQMQGANR